MCWNSSIFQEGAEEEIDGDKLEEDVPDPLLGDNEIDGDKPEEDVPDPLEVMISMPPFFCFRKFLFKLAYFLSNLEDIGEIDYGLQAF